MTLRANTLHPERQLHLEYTNMQVLTYIEANALIEHLFFLNDFNVPADRALFYALANAILHQREPIRMLGQNWIYQYVASRGLQKCPN